LFNKLNLIQHFQNIPRAEYSAIHAIKSKVKSHREQLPRKSQPVQPRSGGIQ